MAESVRGEGRWANDLGIKSTNHQSAARYTTLTDRVASSTICCPAEKREDKGPVAAASAAVVAVVSCICLISTQSAAGTWARARVGSASWDEEG